MKRTISRWVLPVFLILILSISSRAQTETNTDFLSKMNVAFTDLERDRVPYGLLLDYAMEFADLPSYNGVLTDSNKVSAGVLKDIYKTIFTSAIHTNAGGFYSPDYVDSIWQLQRQPGIVTLSGLYYKYAKLRSDAITSNRITVWNNQFFDKYVNGVWRNPYEAGMVFAMSPPLHAYSGKNLQVVLPSNLWHTNDPSWVYSIEVDFNDGAGYRTMTMGQPVTINYADTGTKNWTFKMTLLSDEVLYSRSEVYIAPDPVASNSQARFRGSPVFLTADEAYNGESGQGWVTVDYVLDGQMRNPLIVVEGFDPGYLLDPENQFGNTSINTFMAQTLASTRLNAMLRGDNQEYDIVYVDWYKGADFLQRNALFLERVIRWVNEQKALAGSVAPNVVLGQSMGGVIARWALRDMETRVQPININHDTRLFISWDAPHQGANIPIAYQHAARHGRNLFLSTGAPLLLGGSLNIIRLASNALSLIDRPAVRQLIRNRVDDNGQLENSYHTAWQTELRNMGYPQQCRVVAVSNGNECGAGQGFAPGAILLNLVGKGNTRLLSDLIGSFTGPGLGAWGGAAIILRKPQFLLGIVPGRNDMNFEFKCLAQPTAGITEQIYKGKITYSKKILWTVNVNTTITDRTRNSDPSLLAIDGLNGGTYEVSTNFQSTDFQNYFIKYSMTAYNVPQFNFMPTVSALDIGLGNTALNIADYSTSYVGATPPAAPRNTPFANFTTGFDAGRLAALNPNEDHIDITPRNGIFVAEELDGNINFRTNCSALCTSTQIGGDPIVCGVEQYTVPLIQGATYNWRNSGTNAATFNANQNTYTITRTGTNRGNVTIFVDITSDCGNFTLQRNLEIGSTSLGTPDFAGMPSALCQYNQFNTYVYTQTYSAYTWGVGGGQIVSGQGTHEIRVLVDQFGPGQTSGTLTISLQAYDWCNEPLPVVMKSSPINNCSGGGIESRANPGAGVKAEAELKVFAEVKAYPNPAKQSVTIEAPNGYLQGTLVLLTLDGKPVLRQNINSNVTVLNITAIASGMYVAELTAKNGQKQKIKIVITK